MKRNIKGWLFKSVLLLTLSISTISCKKLLDIAPEDALEYDKAYQNVFDADAVIIGLYGQLAGIADRYMVLNELRADLEDVTVNSDKYLRQINTHSVTVDNPWANPKPFYEIIINCNDALKNFDRMLADKRLTQEEYDIRYSEVGAMRSWVYLQVGIHYGSVPYVTEPLESIQDVQDESKYPLISFDQLLTNILQFTEALPRMNPIPAGNSLLINLDGYNTTKMFINKKLLLGDLNLWKGNWTKAATYYHDVMNYADVEYPAMDSEQWYETYKVSSFTASRGGNANWDLAFNQAFGERGSYYEILNNIPFDKRFSPKNPFIEMYAYFGGKYLIQPSANAIQNWDGQTLGDGTPRDIHRGEGNSYVGRISPVIDKLIATYNPTTPFETGGKWTLYRAALLHLRMSEAAIHDNQDSLAYALINNGISSTFRPASLPSNVTNIMQSDFPNFSSPYYFDGRNGEAPRFRAAWYRNSGIRGRVSLAPAKVDSVQFFDFSSPGNPRKAFTNKPGFIRAMEDIIIKEAALELAFEGNRWQDLLRIAKRRRAEDPNYLANKVAAKFEAKGDMATANEVRVKLSNEANWYLPFKWQ
ncbi:RagB/SusD family nutrient uptake outer membrane protein [Pedobacter sp. P351]|uniref:RagB/SusD family nutrient uptake outer membrane protein n=1 Tax=Pedobacter superstes TaxID=3133441 RepID=UPI0030A8BB95